MTTDLRSTDDLTAGLEHVRQSPSEEGTVELIVRRPQVEEREVLEQGELTLEEGLVGDCWGTRSAHANPKAQVTLTNSRATDLVAGGDRERWALAGDQFYVDFDLSDENLPAGTRVAIGAAVLEVTDIPHTGCGKYTARFGADARAFVNSPEGLALNRRRINTRVVEPGTVRRGDAVRKLA
jgi:MOSC domain-containing protein YiiM